ncbi:hypothetical protein SAMN06265222_105202 [Neorhodopirellula lusitana]|uniref:Transmembrane protein n=1 Tax=Neorhodopirellula lusitana TaxID=445327 RepID=A0ABY1Q2Z6_9BACT|nr:hypothetical protein [Neorhodopirellula lusitana]SMP56747.1 hypothetical protein SAMN06265222_105202 [Neorhodopirellula lusitana]
MRPPSSVAKSRRELEHAGTKPSAAGRSTRFAFALLAFVFFSLLGNRPAPAQPPGTMPPSGLLRSEAPWTGPLQGIRPNAFLFQDESNTPVVIPRMSFEEIDRLLKRDRGLRASEQIATLERLDLNGHVSPERAELEARLVIRFDPSVLRHTGQPTAVIDLGFDGSNLLDAANVELLDRQTSVNDAYVCLQPVDEESGEQGGGYQLVIPVESLLDTSDGVTDADSSNLESSNSQRTDSGLTDEGLTQEVDSYESTTLVVLTMKFSNRVDGLSLRQSAMQLKLPNVSTVMNLDFSPRVNLDSQSSGDEKRPVVSLNLVGTGREVVRRVDLGDRFVIECGGGDVSLNWLTLPESLNETGDLIEVESEAEVQWDSPSDPVAMNIRLLTRNLRGPLRSFETQIPAGMVLLSPPELVKVNSSGRNSGDASPGATISSSSAAIGSDNNMLWDVRVVPGEQPGARKVVARWAGHDSVAAAPSAAQLRLQLRQSAVEASAAQPWVLTIPQVDRSIGHRGSVTVRTSEDHRLRWRPRLGIDAIVSLQANDQNGDLSYPFRFSQNRFELPVWLSAKQQQQRLNVNLELEVTRQAARVELVVQADGSGIDPKGLRMEMGDWRLLDIRTSETAVSTSIKPQDPKLDISASDSIVEWQVDTSDGKWPDTYRILAELPAPIRLPASEGEAAGEGTSAGDVVAEEKRGLFETLDLPRLISTTPSVVVTDVRMNLVDRRRESWTVDLPQSPTLQRLETGRRVQFRVISPDSPWILRGQFATKPLKLNWTANVTFLQSGNEWASRAVWSVQSDADLEGRLRFSMPGVDPQWSVAVNGTPAIVRLVEAAESITDDDATVETEEDDTDGLEVELANEPNDASTEAVVDVEEARKLKPSAESTAGLAKRQVWEIVSPELSEGTHQIELSFRQPIPLLSDDSDFVGRGDSNGMIASKLVVPTPVADQVDIPTPVVVSIPTGIADASGYVWRLTPRFDGILSDLATAGDFRQRAAERGDLTDAAIVESDGPRRTSEQWLFRVLPDFAIPVTLRNRDGEEQLTEIPRSFLRSLIGEDFRHEHLLALVQRGERVRLGLPASLKTIRVEVRLDGQPIASTRDASGLRIDFPKIDVATLERRNATSPNGLASDTGSEPNAGTADADRPVNAATALRSAERVHLLDVRIWTETASSPWWSQIRPMLRLPIGSGLQYWQLVVPTDSHLFWASSQSGRAMHWQRDQLRMARLPSISDRELIRWTSDLNWQFGDDPRSPVDGYDPASVAGVLTAEMIRESLSESSFTVPGNRYLFFAGNSHSFSAITVSRTLLWLGVGSMVLILAIGFEWFPSLHHPLTAFALAVFLAGILVLAPDGVVLTAQLVMISLSLVAVFYAISAIVVPRNSQRVLASGANGSSRRVRGSQIERDGRRADSASQRRRTDGERRATLPGDKPVKLGGQSNGILGNSEAKGNEAPTRSVEHEVGSLIGTTQEYAQDTPLSKSGTHSFPGPPAQLNQAAKRDEAAKADQRAQFDRMDGRQEGQDLVHDESGRTDLANSKSGHQDSGHQDSKDQDSEHPNSTEADSVEDRRLDLADSKSKLESPAQTEVPGEDV